MKVSPLVAPLSESARLLTLTPPSWLVPVERLWTLADTARRWRARRRDRFGPADIIIAYVLSDYVTPQEAGALYWAWQTRSLEASMRMLALRRPGRRWSPRIRLRGLNNLTASLERRAGTILWISDFVYEPLIIRMALRQAGISAVFLSRPEHGFSISPFGIRFLNPLWKEVEDRFQERVLIKNNDAREALQRLRTELGRNGIVSITVAETGRRTFDARFFRGRLRIATGPAHLARTSRAALLPVFTVRNEDGAYDVSIGRPLEVDDASEPDYAVALHAYTAMLQPIVQRHSDQWNGWDSMARLAEKDPGFVAAFASHIGQWRDLEPLLRTAPAPRAMAYSHDFGRARSRPAQREDSMATPRANVSPTTREFSMLLSHKMHRG